jgi:hypothetical protein
VKLLAIILAALLLLAHPWLAVAVLAALMAACGGLGLLIGCTMGGRPLQNPWRTT